MNMTVDENKNLPEFIKNLQTYGLLERENKFGLIIYADDQHVNRMALKMAFEEVGLADRLLLLENG